VTIRLPRLSADPSAPFPSVATALSEPNGLLAFGGDLHPTRLITAYRNGIFPWYSRGEPILWWSPDPRVVYDTATFVLARRFRRDLRQRRWRLTADTAFESVIAACASAPRPGQSGTWITAEMRAAYVELHRLGHAHSVEAWDDTRLVGGIYGVSAGSVFCGESMFSAESGGSKVALAGLCRWLAQNGVDLLDAQVPNPHLESLGARSLARPEYLLRLARPVLPVAEPGPWTERFPRMDAAELA
jgi:leucyl/phenylalanyl-tRNA--protein transferase